MSKPKSPDEILQEEFLRERAEVLGRAGTRVLESLNTLRRIEEEIAAAQGRYEELAPVQAVNSPGGGESRTQWVRLRREIDAQVHRYNRVREEAKLRYYYLIVTREALGLRRHHWVEAAYRIPPKKAMPQDG